MVDPHFGCGLRIQGIEKGACSHAPREVHHVLSAAGIPVIADKPFQLGGFKENGFARESDALQPAFANPAHDRRAMDMPEMHGRFRERKQLRAGYTGTHLRLRLSGHPAGGKTFGRSFDCRFHDGIGPTGALPRSVNLFTR